MISRIPLIEMMIPTLGAPLLEAEGGGYVDGKPKDLYLKGIFIQGDVKNQNQRIYPSTEIRKAVDQMTDILKAGQTILGEADHPQQMTINLDRVSHMITEIRMEGADGIGKLKIIPTPLGNLCRTIIEAGGKLGVSSRGEGKVDNSGRVSDFEISTIDIVANPSAPNAYPTPVYESLSKRYGTDTLMLAEAINHDPQAQKFLRENLKKFLSGL